MMKHNFWSFLILTLFLMPFSGFVSGQEKSVNVERCKVLDQSSPIHNIWVDSDNIKWVANSNGLNKVLALDVIEKVSIPAGTTSLLTIRGGNAQIEWSTSAMQQLLGNVNISCASYNPKTKTVWLGTKESGAFEVALSPLRIVQTLNTGNRKLTSNQINDIFIRSNGTIYIATNDGMLVGSGDKWDLLERYLNFIGVDAWGDNMWILGDDFLWQVDNKGKWSPIAIELRNVEGQMRDIAVDDEGRVWIASNMMTGYDVAAEKYQRFGPGQYFTSQFVNCLDVDHDGSIWTGTNDKGLYLIQWESSLILTISQDQALDCKTNSAALSVKVAGGQPPYAFVWNNGQTTQKISQLSSGEYIVTVTDASGLTKTGKYEIPDPGLTVTVENIKPSTGSSANGRASLVVKGGTGQYMYAWDNGEALSSASKLSSGNHTVTVTDKAGCSAVTTVNVTEVVIPLAVTVETIKENKCAGSSEGELRASVSGGKEPYKFVWSSNGGKESLLSSLGAGSYTVTVTDATGQSATSSKVLLSPDALAATIQILLPASVNSSNGQAQAKATGGKPPYTYQWENGETNAINNTLKPGLNAVTVTDANGCTSVATVNMTENITEMTASISQAGEINCSGGGVQELKVEVSGGKSPYQYKWNSGQQTQSLQNAKAGNYQVTVTDVSGQMVTAHKEIKQPSPVALTVLINGAATNKGNDGSATVKANGGAGIYNFEWDNGEKSNKATKLGAGKHTVTVTDGSGCTAVGEIDISENILALQVSVNQVSEIKCAGDAAASLEAIVTGGKEPYTYKWSNDASAASLTALKDGLFTLTVTDVTGHTATTAVTIDAPLPLELNVRAEAPASTNGSNGRAVATVTGGKGKYSYLWDNGEKTSRAEKLNAGNHTLLVTDENGCTAEGTVVITENILPLSAEITQSGEILCTGQKGVSLNVNVKGGKEPFVYSWSGLDNGSSSTMTNIGAGKYSLKVTDAAGNVTTSQFVVTEPAPLQIIADKVTPASTGNSDGEVTLKVTGGTLPYSFRNTVLPNTTTIIAVDKLSPGAHKMVVTDKSGCTAEVNITITEDILPLTASIKEARAVLCADAVNGSLEASAKGGKPPYTFTWSNGTTSAALDNVSAGSYSVVVKDASGQESKVEHIVKPPAPIVVEVVNLRSATNDRINDGKGSVEIKGGTAPFTYKWPSGETSLNAVQLPLGQGKVIVTDKNGCTASAEFIVKEKVLPELTSARLASGEPIRMEKIQFEADSVKIEAEAIPSLDELYNFLYDNPTTIIEVAGHTNGLPADDYCDRISAERAKSVADYLISKGIEPRRVISKGYGKRKPVATNQTPEGRKRNQRVEIRLININE